MFITHIIKQHVHIEAYAHFFSNDIVCLADGSNQQVCIAYCAVAQHMFLSPNPDGRFSVPNYFEL